MVYHASMQADTRVHIDLHIHTNCSDGAFSPKELVQRAAQEGIETIAIADHDSVSGIAEAIAAGLACDVEVIPAVELSVQFNEYQDVHLLGYGMDWADPVFLQKLDRFRERREHRNEEILERVNAMLADERLAEIALTEVLAFARDTIGRPHIARALLDRGYVSNIEDAFRRYLVPCNVPKLYWPIEDAIAEIRRIGGISVLAHPTSVSTDRQQLREIITELSESGLDGVEVYNNMAQQDEMEFLRRLAGELGLLVTGGSDFHGIEDGLQIGRGRGGIRFSNALLAPIRKRLSTRRNQLLSLYAL
jgi:predicted metal-dependent phosphoesterase TrpH